MIAGLLGLDIGSKEWFDSMVPIVKPITNRRRWSVSEVKNGLKMMHGHFSATGNRPNLV